MYSVSKQPLIAFEQFDTSTTFLIPDSSLCPGPQGTSELTSGFFLHESTEYACFNIEILQSGSGDSPEAHNIDLPNGEI